MAIFLDFAFWPSPTLAFSAILGFFTCDAFWVGAGDASDDAARFFEPLVCDCVGPAAEAVDDESRYDVSSTLESVSPVSLSLGEESGWQELTR
jgi:hypothetical protein